MNEQCIAMSGAGRSFQTKILPLCPSRFDNWNYRKGNGFPSMVFLQSRVVRSFAEILEGVSERETHTLD